MLEPMSCLLERRIYHRGLRTEPDLCRFITGLESQWPFSEHLRSVSYYVCAGRLSWSQERVPTSNPLSIYCGLQHLVTLKVLTSKHANNIQAIRQMLSCYLAVALICRVALLYCCKAKPPWAGSILDAWTDLSSLSKRSCMEPKASTAC